VFYTSAALFVLKLKINYPAAAEQKKDDATPELITHNTHDNHTIDDMMSG
jgi:hypothetical protein